MKRSRSLGLLLSAFGVVLLVSSCVIKSSDDEDDDTTGGSGGKGSSGTGGTTSGGGTGGGDSGGTGGGNTGGAGTGGGNTGGGGTGGGTGGMSGAAGDAGMSGGGAGGAPSYDECVDCLEDRCANELANCLDSELCYSAAGDGSGQYEIFSDCVEAERPFGSINRTLLRECGTQVIEGQVIWPPPGMSPATRDLINCLATGVADVNPDDPNNAWAEDDQIMMPWAAESCARLACTSQTDQ